MVFLQFTYCLYTVGVKTKKQTVQSLPSCLRTDEEYCSPISDPAYRHIESKHCATQFNAMKRIIALSGDFSQSSKFSHRQLNTKLTHELRHIVKCSEATRCSLTTVGVRLINTSSQTQNAAIFESTHTYKQSFFLLSLED